MSGFRVETEGFDEIRQGLHRIDRKVGSEMAKVNKDIGQSVLRHSERRRAQLSGRFGSYRSHVVDTKVSSNQKQVEWTVTPAAAEFGAARHPVFGRWMAQASFVRLVWPLPNRDGWLVSPTIEDRFDEISDEYTEAVVELARQAIGD